MGIIQNTLEQGLIYAIMALGVLITYSILDFPDLSVDSRGLSVRRSYLTTEYLKLR